MTNSLAGVHSVAALFRLDSFTFFFFGCRVCLQKRSERKNSQPGLQYLLPFLKSILFTLLCLVCACASVYLATTFTLQKVFFTLFGPFRVTNFKFKLHLLPVCLLPTWPAVVLHLLFVCCCFFLPSNFTLNCSISQFSNGCCTDCGHCFEYIGNFCMYTATFITICFLHFPSSTTAQTIASCAVRVKTVKELLDCVNYIFDTVCLRNALHVADSN